MAKLQQTFVAAALAIGLGHSVQSVQHPGEHPHIRFRNDRIAEVFAFAMKNSPAFGDLVATLDWQDRVVYLEEGQCHRTHNIDSCLQMMSTPGGRYIQIRIDPRQSIVTVAVRLAHELYHASEIARDPTVVDADSVRRLFEQIGYRNRTCPASLSCWETRAAVAFEALVTKELNGA